MSSPGLCQGPYAKILLFFCAVKTITYKTVPEMSEVFFLYPEKSPEMRYHKML